MSIRRGEDRVTFMHVLQLRMLALALYKLDLASSDDEDLIWHEARIWDFPMITDPRVEKIELLRVFLWMLGRIDLSEKDEWMDLWNVAHTLVDRYADRER
jgi:hypothetical protein